MKKSFRCCIVLFLLISGGVSFCDNWTLAATKFTFTRKTPVSSAQESAATILPSLILERIADSPARMTTDEELLDRKLNEYLTERQSLFLQLSKEVQTRDSLVLTEDNPRKLKKLIAAENEKIEEIQQQIQENISNCEKAKAQVEKRKAGAENTEEDESKGRFSFFPFNPFSDSEEEEDLVDYPSAETLVFYNNDSTSLLSFSDEITADAYTGRKFEKEVVSKKINGLICGSITVYGDYASVTASLYIYPGAKNAGTVTEVGSLNDCMSIASNIARYMIPKILNSRPVEVNVNISSEEEVIPVVTVDGVVFSNYSRLIFDSGIHTLEFSAKNYMTKSITYNFEGDRKFTVEVPMEKENKGQVLLYLRYPVLSTVYADGKLSGKIADDMLSVPVTVNGNAVIGQVVSDSDSSYYFYYIPENLSESMSDIMVKGKSTDVAAQIEKRRIWMYRSYSLLVLSLPFTLYSQGRYQNMVNGYNAGTYTNVDEINKWNTYQTISTGVTIGCACLFAFELVRYLRTANKALPVYAVPAKERDILKAEDWYKASLNSMIEEKLSVKNNPEEDTSVKSSSDTDINN
ncbi:hypothetical protein [Treponema sp.]|uniref:hypothetical protein n=1 Tax=Treponema sp. TaxID=166 RepID=UPI0025F53520|nr:hypothetical protein [Treponema sp.]MCR5219129.1 hypothetical protein [Treponema sp.]